MALAAGLLAACSSTGDDECRGTRPPTFLVVSGNEAPEDRIVSVSATRPCQDPVCNVSGQGVCNAWSIDGPPVSGARCSVTITVETGKSISFDVTVEPFPHCPVWFDFSPRDAAVLCTPDAGAGANPDSGCIFPDDGSSDGGVDGG